MIRPDGAASDAILTTLSERGMSFTDALAAVDRDTQPERLTLWDQPADLWSE